MLMSEQLTTTIDAKNGCIQLGDEWNKQPTRIIIYCDEAKFAVGKITLISNEPDCYGNILDYDTIIFNVAGKETIYDKRKNTQ
jgi:hypothetical protein